MALTFWYPESMSQTFKFLLFGIVCAGLGAGAFYMWSNMEALKKENAELSMYQQPSPLPTGIVTSSPSPKVQAQQTGNISGKLSFPSEGIPPLTVYAFKEGDTSTYYKVATQQNQNTYLIKDVPVGTYVVVAYTNSSPAIGAGYTPAVPCGLNVTCTDHSLIPIVVVSGKTVQDVDVQDWYAPADAFPGRPE